jgi:hypothetical protein
MSIKCLFYTQIIFFILQAPSLLAQDTSSIGGIVVDSTDQSVLINCIITLHSDIDSSLISFTTSDLNGRWIFKDSARKGSFVKFKMLGYNTKMETCDRFLNSKNLKTSLSPSSINLDDILIKAKRIGIQQKGDTIDYDLKSFTTGKERNLGDVLNKLPGMDVSSEGDINYNGSRVDVLLIEAKDVLNNQHKLAVDGLMATDIEDVQIIENFKDESELSNKQSDKVAMNVELTKEAKAKWRGLLSVDIGYKKKLKADPSVFNINDVWSTTIFGRFNNVGESLMSVKDFLSMQVSLTTTLNNNKDNLEAILPRHFLLPFDLTHNTDGLIAANIHKEKKDKTSSKLSLNILDLNRNQDLKFSRNYQATDDVFNGDTRIDANLTSFTLHYRETWKLSKKSILTFNLPVNLLDEHEIDEVKGLFNSKTTEAINTNGLNRYRLNPTIKYSNQLKDKWILTFFAAGKYMNSILKNNIEDINPLYDTDFFQIDQSQDNIEIEYAISASSEYDIRDGHKAGISLLNTVNEQSIITKSSSADFTSDNSQSSTTSSSMSLFYNFKNSRFLFEPTFSVAWYDRQFQESQGTGFNYKINQLIKYSFSQLHFILLKYTNRTYLPSFDQFHNSLIIEDQVSMRRSIVLPESTIREQNFSLTYLTYQLDIGLRFHTIFQYKSGSGQPYQRVISKDDYIVNEWNSNINSQSISLKNTISFPVLQKRISIRSHSDFKWQSNLLDEDIQFDNSTISSSLRAITKFKDSPVNGSVGYSIVSQSSDQGDRVIGFLKHSVPVELSYTSRHIKLDLSFSYNVNRIDSHLSTYSEVGAELLYSLGNKFDLKLRGVNVLNLNGVPDINTRYNSVFIQENEFIRFPGFLTIGLQKTL